MCTHPPAPAPALRGGRRPRALPRRGAIQPSRKQPALAAARPRQACGSSQVRQDHQRLTSQVWPRASCAALRSCPLFVLCSDSSSLPPFLSWRTDARTAAAPRRRGAAAVPGIRRFLGACRSVGARVPRRAHTRPKAQPAGPRTRTRRSTERVRRGKQ